MDLTARKTKEPTPVSPRTTSGKLLAFLNYHFLFCKYCLPYRDLMWIKLDNMCTESGTCKHPANYPSLPFKSVWEVTGSLLLDTWRIRALKSCWSMSGYFSIWGAQPWKLVWLLQPYFIGLCHTYCWLHYKAVFLFLFFFLTGQQCQTGHQKREYTSEIWLSWKTLVKFDCLEKHFL